MGAGMIEAGQLRVWFGMPSSGSGLGGGECFLVLDRTPFGSRVSRVWRVLLSTGEVAMFDDEFLERESEEPNT